MLALSQQNKEMIFTQELYYKARMKMKSIGSNMQVYMSTSCLSHRASNLRNTCKTRINQ